MKVDTTLALAVALVTGLVTALREWRNHVLHSEIADLQQRLNESLKLQGRAQQEVEAMKMQLDLRDALVTAIGGGVYYRRGADGALCSGPFCVRCQDYDGKLVHLQLTAQGLYCPQCKRGVLARNPQMFDHR